MTKLPSVILVIFIMFSIINGNEYASVDDYDFIIFACGIYGGGFGKDLTAYLMANVNDRYNFISLDAGTSYDCLVDALENGQLNSILDYDNYLLSEYNKVAYFKKKQVNGFFVSHAHLDHNMGLMVSAPDDSFDKKPIISKPQVISDFLYNSFKAPLWIDYSIFGYYNVSLNPMDNGLTSLETFGFSEMNAKTFSVPHTINSTAIMVCDKDVTSCVLFFGDTGSDIIENSNELNIIWEYIADFIRNGTLNTIFIECSFRFDYFDILNLFYIT